MEILNTTHLSALALIILIYAALAVTYIGWGKAAAYLLRLNGEDHFSVTSLIWLGWAVTLLIFQIVHFALPLTAFVTTPLFVLGFIFAAPGIVASYRCHTGQSLILLVAKILGMIFVVLILTGWIASRAMLPPIVYDTGLYHFNAIRWINSFPIVPGLGNLHGRLAFNQSFFTYVAALNFYPFFGYGRSIANSFLILLAIATCVEMARPAFNRPSLLADYHPYLYVSSIFILPILGYLSLSSRGLSSPSPDLTSSLMQLCMFVILVHGIGDLKSGRTKQWRTAFLLAILAATAVTIKLSNLAFSAVIFSFAFAYAWRESGSVIRPVAYLAFPAAVICMVWCLRGFILSGAPLYPTTIGHIAVDWAVPRRQLVEEANWIYSWARLPRAHWHDVLGNWNWFRPWLIRTLNDFTGFVYPSGLFAVTAAVIAVRSKYTKPRMIECFILFPLLIGLVYWFFTAPDTRFAHALFFLLPTAAFLVLLSVLHGEVSKNVFAWIVLLVFIVGNLHVFRYMVVCRAQLKAISTSGFHEAKRASLEKRATPSGLLVYTPKNGDQCWDSPLPCTPGIQDDLRLRVPGNLASGFTVQPAFAQSR